MIKNRDHYSFGFFVNQSILPNSETIAKLMTEFKEWNLLPTFGVINNTEISNKFQLQLFTETKDLVIDFEPFRYNIKSFNFDNNLLDFEEFVRRSEKIIKFLVKLNGNKGHRLSFATKALCEEMSEEKLDNINKLLFKLPNIYRSNRPIEWSSRQIARVNYKINNKDELINLITDINRIQGIINSEGTQINFDRVEIKFDINTFQENTTPRFDEKDVNPFLQIAFILKNEIEQELQGMFNEKQSK